MNAVINWVRLARALDYYQRIGFARVEVPWVTRGDVSAITCPDTSRAYPFEGDVLVGSAEQAFMQMQFDERLPDGRYVALTPCFRNEPVPDALHQKYFMKVELYVAGVAPGDVAKELVEIARSFMKTETADDIEIVPTDIGYDLEINGIEVGSYSTRTFGRHTWTCGTGLACPRFSQAVSAGLMLG